jgi:hypothetical protein
MIVPHCLAALLIGHPQQPISHPSICLAATLADSRGDMLQLSDQHSTAMHGSSTRPDASEGITSTPAWHGYRGNTTITHMRHSRRHSQSDHHWAACQASHQCHKAQSKAQPNRHYYNLITAQLLLPPSCKASPLNTRTHQSHACSTCMADHALN